jgi:hypothetical protein
MRTLTPAAIRGRLEETVGPVPYSDLVAHLGRDAVFVVSTAVSLVECGVSIALDDVEVVQGLIARGELRKPSAAERTSWAATPERTWTAVVVQPFVLVQDPVGHAAPSVLA